MMTPLELTGQTDSHLGSTLVGQKTFLVHPNVEHDLLALKQAADNAGFEFNIASGFRDYQRQCTIWNNKMSGQSVILDSNSQPLDSHGLSDGQKVQAILRWSALPGSSRHHWGSDFDVFDREALPDGETLKLEPWEYLDGHQSEFYQWLKTHLAEFGFFFPYRQDLGGVSPEPWHISHRATAQSCLAALTPKLLAEQISQTPFLGAEYVLEHLDSIYTGYIANIDQAS